MIAFWIVAVVAAITSTRGVAEGLGAAGFTSPEFESSRVDQLLIDRLGANPTASVYVVYQDPAGNISAADPEFARQIEDSMIDVRSLPEIGRVMTPVDNPDQIAPDGRSAYAMLALRAEAADSRRLVGNIRQALRPAAAGHVGGARSSTATFCSDRTRPQACGPHVSVRRSRADRGLRLARPRRRAGLIGGAAVVTLAVIAVLSRFVDLSVFSLNLITMLGLGLGIDYSLIIVSRFREQLAQL